MYHPGITGWRAQYERFERAYARLQGHYQHSFDYDANLQIFWMHSLHLCDWIGKDQATNIRFIDLMTEMLSYNALQDAADLANGGKHLVRRKQERETYVTRQDVAVHLAQDKPIDLRHTVTRADGSALSAQDLVHGVRAAWQTILRRRGLIA